MLTVVFTVLGFAVAILCIVLSLKYDSVTARWIAVFLFPAFLCVTPITVGYFIETKVVLEQEAHRDLEQRYETLLECKEWYISLTDEDIDTINEKLKEDPVTTMHQIRYLPSTIFGYRSVSKEELLNSINLRIRHYNNDIIEYQEATRDPFSEWFSTKHSFDKYELIPEI